MPTYGPTRLSLMERLAAADLVAVIGRAELVRSERDELSERGRELGVFELAVASVLDGEADDVLRVRVVSDGDGRWPIRTDGRFLAFLQREPDGGWVLAHESAFPLRGSTFMFSERLGDEARGRRGEATTLATVRRLVRERAAAAAAEAEELRRLEGRAMKAKPAPLPTEMPESDEVVAWLAGRMEAGREGKRPSDAAPREDN
jgi:hypothetical protein